MTTARTDIERLAVDAVGAAALFSVSLRTWRRWDCSGKCPRGFRLGGRLLWRLADLRRWADGGFVSRVEFDALLHRNTQGVPGGLGVKPTRGAPQGSQWRRASSSTEVGTAERTREDTQP